MLELLEDQEGSVGVGWVGDGVLYTHYQGGLSATVGEALAARVTGYLEQVTSLHYFSDASALNHYDLLARSLFVRMVLAHRRKFRSIVMLTWSDGASTVTETLKSVIGEPLEVMTEPQAFSARMMRLAPRADQWLDPTLWRPSTAPLSSRRMV
jgi:hypothetical protein